MSTRAIVILPLALLLGAFACGGKQPIDLSGTWPAKPGDYREVTDAWTRYGNVRAGAEQHGLQIMEVYATFKSPAWRAAYVDFRSDRLMLPANERAALAKEQRAEAEEYYEFVLLVSTYDRRANDLQKGDRSTWRVALVDDEGQEVEPVDIDLDRRPPTEIRGDFRHFGDFHKAYIVRFPKTIDLLGPDAREFALKMASQRGGVKLVWKKAGEPG